MIGFGRMLVCLQRTRPLAHLRNEPPSSSPGTVRLPKCSCCCALPGSCMVVTLHVLLLVCGVVCCAVVRNGVLQVLVRAMPTLLVQTAARASSQVCWQHHCCYHCSCMPARDACHQCMQQHQCMHNDMGPLLFRPVAVMMHLCCSQRYYCPLLAGFLLSPLPLLCLAASCCIMPCHAVPHHTTSCQGTLWVT